MKKNHARLDKRLPVDEIDRNTRTATTSFHLHMTEKSNIIWQIFQAIENNDDGQMLWDLMEQTTSTDGIVYMTYGSETPQSLAEKSQRKHLLKLIQIHQQLTCLRIQF